LYNSSSNDLHCQILVSPSGSRLFYKVITLTNLLHCEVYLSEFHITSQEMQRDFMACMQLCINIIKSVSVRTFFSLYIIYKSSCLKLGCYGISCSFAVHFSMNISSTTFSLNFLHKHFTRESNKYSLSNVMFHFISHHKVKQHNTSPKHTINTENFIHPEYMVVNEVSKGPSAHYHTLYGQP